METASPPRGTETPADSIAGHRPAPTARDALRFDGWPVERVISLLAGSFILFSLGMGRVHHPRWRLMAGMIGTNLVFQARAGWCPASLAVRKLGVPTSAERACGAELRESPGRP